jgi:hypothetical protein
MERGVVLDTKYCIGLLLSPRVFDDFASLLSKIEILPQSRRGRGEVIFYLAVRGRQIKSPLLARTRILCSPAAIKRNLYLFPKGESL